MLRSREVWGVLRGLETINQLVYRLEGDSQLVGASLQRGLTTRGSLHYASEPSTRFRPCSSSCHFIFLFFSFCKIFYCLPEYFVLFFPLTIFSDVFHPQPHYSLNHYPLIQPPPTHRTTNHSPSIIPAIQPPPAHHHATVLCEQDLYQGLSSLQAPGSDDRHVPTLPRPFHHPREPGLSLSPFPLVAFYPLACSTVSSVFFFSSFFFPFSLTQLFFYFSFFFSLFPTCACACTPSKLCLHSFISKFIY